MKLKKREYYLIKYKLSLRKKKLLDDKYEKMEEYQHFARKPRKG